MAAEDGGETEGAAGPHTRDPRSYTAAEHGEDGSNGSQGGGEQGQGSQGASQGQGSQGQSGQSQGVGAQGGGKKDDGGKADGKKGRKKRPFTRLILILLVVVLLIGGFVYWLYASQFQSTDDAFIDTHLVRLAPRISGRVAEVLVADNQKVEAGQVVIRLDPRDQEATVSQAQAQRAQAEAQIAQAQATLQQDDAQVRVSEATYNQDIAQAASSAAQATNAARDLIRYQTLKGVNASAVSQQQLDQAQAQAQSTSAQRDASLHQADAAKRQIAAVQAQEGTARAQIAAGQAQVAAADAQIRSAQLQLDYTTVVAPEAGVVAQRSVAIGNYVNAGAQIMAIVPLRTWVTANFKETQLPHMRPGQIATIHIDACPEANVLGHVDSIQHGSGQAFAILPPENATGNFVKVVQRVPVKILIDQVPPECPLGPGLSVEPKVRIR